VWSYINNARFWESYGMIMIQTKAVTFMPLAWIEEQPTIIRSHIETLLNSNLKLDTLSSIYQNVAKFDLQNEDTQYVKEALLRKIVSVTEPGHYMHLVGMWRLTEEKMWDHERWPELL
jgi:hypothetical protein